MQKQTPLLGKDGAVSINKLRRHLQVFHQLKLRQMPDVLPRKRHFIFYELGVSTRAYNFAKQSALRAFADSFEDAKNAQKRGEVSEALFIFLEGLSHLKNYQPARYNQNALKFYFAAKGFLNSKDSPIFAESAKSYPNEWHRLFILWDEIKLEYTLNASLGAQSFNELAAQAGYGKILKKAV